MQFWKNTPIEDAINYVAAKPAPVGGTSAGMAIMSEFVYSAMSNSSLTSEEGLADPFHRDLTLDRDFVALPKLQGLITDQHLQERDRMGRTVAFLARLVTDGWTAEGRAIAADRETALHVDPTDGTAEVFSTPTHPTPYVYFLSTPGPPEVCQPGTPLTYRNVNVYRIGPGDRFDLDRWRGTGGIALHAHGGGRRADIFARRDLLSIHFDPGLKIRVLKLLQEVLTGGHKGCINRFVRALVAFNARRRAEGAPWPGRSSQAVRRSMCDYHAP